MAEPLPRYGMVGWDNGYRSPSGYAVDCVILCPDCCASLPPDHRGEAWGFGSHVETDSPEHCDTCGILIPTSLTSDGIEYVRSIDGRTRAGRLYRQAYPWVWR